MGETKFDTFWNSSKSAKFHSFDSRVLMSHEEYPVRVVERARNGDTDPMSDAGSGRGLTAKITNR